MRNIPRTDARYWAILVSACCIGETLGDYVSHGLSLGYGMGSLVLFILFAGVFAAELRAAAPSEARYWTAIIITSTTGTTLADFVTRSLKLGYGGGSVLLLVLLAVLLVAGWRRSGSTVKEDGVYWMTLLVVSTFGTTMGDYVSDGLELGPGKGSLLLAGLLAAVLAAGRIARIPARAHYWSAVIITGTVGATTGDFLTKEDGLELGYARGTALLVAAFLLVLGVTAVTSRWTRRSIASASQEAPSPEAEPALPGVEAP